MEFNKQGKKLSSNAQLLVMSMHDPDRPKLDTATLDKIALSKESNDLPVFQQKRGRGRPRKNPVESEIQIDLKENYISDIKEKLDTAELDKIALSKPANDLPEFQQKRGRGRPRKNPIVQQTQSKPANDLPEFQQQRGRGRPRKNTVESEIQIDLKENYILDIKENLKLLEIITNGYREIERIDKETQKNVKKLCALMHNAN